MGKVYLTGAGPGDIELITVKALKLIQTADVIIYDKLVNPQLLKESKSDAILIDVGKQRSKHKVPQDKINELIYQNALQYNIVVRLKGGDPFVFGRGGEEALYLKQRDIKFEIVPGVTSATSVLAYAGIPITHRNITPSFKVITGHRKLSENIADINWSSMCEDETLVFLMGLHNIELIVTNLLQIGKDKNTPCAIISNGTTKGQKVITGNLENILKKSENATTPAIIVVGNVVSLREQLCWFDD